MWKHTKTKTHSRESTVKRSSSRHITAWKNRRRHVQLLFELIVNNCYCCQPKDPELRNECLHKNILRCWLLLFGCITGAHRPLATGFCLPSSPVCCQSATLTFICLCYTGDIWACSILLLQNSRIGMWEINRNTGANLNLTFWYRMPGEIQL